MNSDELFLYLKENVKGNGKGAIFIDEIQDVESFEITLRDLVA